MPSWSEFLDLARQNMQANKMSEELTDQVLDKSSYDETTKSKIKDIFVNSQNSKTHSRHINRELLYDISGADSYNQIGGEQSW